MMRAREIGYTQHKCLNAGAKRKKEERSEPTESTIFLLNFNRFYIYNAPWLCVLIWCRFFLLLLSFHSRFDDEDDDNVARTTLSTMARPCQRFMGWPGVNFRIFFGRCCYIASHIASRTQAAEIKMNTKIRFIFCSLRKFGLCRRHR